ncbi:F-box protein SKIP19 [Linum perenne]
MSQLAVVDRLKTAQNVCSSWRKVCRDPYLWRSIDLTYLEEAYDMKRYCTKAIDLSCGGLVSVSVEDYDSDELLNYIADKSSQLKRLRLLRCEHTSDQGFSTAVQKLVFLEELEMSYCSVTQDALKVAAAGRFCPLLKSLKLNQECLKYYNIKSDKEAEAIAENMPGLRHLQLFGNKLTNHGLQAILDRCSQLESLDLRQCFNLQMGGDLDYGSSDDDYPSGYYGYESPTYDGYDGYSDMLADFEFPNADYELSLDHGMLPGTYHEFQADSDLSDPEF